MASACAWCGAAFGDGGQLLAHILAEHAPPTPTVAPSTSTDTAVSEDHTAVSASGRPDCTCLTCGKKFKHKRSLVRHVKEKHSGGVARLVCQKCQKTFQSKRTLTQHGRIVHEKESDKCDRCGGRFRDRWAVLAHQRLNRCRTEKSFTRHRGPKCRDCKRVFDSVVELYRHKKTDHPLRLSKKVCLWCRKQFATPAMLLQHHQMCSLKKRREENYRRLRTALHTKLPSRERAGPEGAAWKLVQSAADGNARVHEIMVTDVLDLQLTLIKQKDKITEILTKDMIDLRRIKWYLCAFIQVEADGTTDPNDTRRYMRCEPMETLRVRELSEQVEQGILGVVNSFDTAVHQGSRMLFERVEKLELRVAKFSPLKGSSYMELPKWLQNPGKGLINIQNSDQKCFLYSCLAALELPKNHPERVRHYLGRVNEINMKGIHYPVTLNSIKKFEENNPGISCTVFGLEGKNVVPLRVTKNVRQKHINLLLLRDIDDDENYYEGHYVLVNNLSRFLSHLTKKKKRLFWCENCLTPRPTLDGHMKHRERCLQHRAQAVTLPTGEAGVIRFTDFDKMQRHDYVIYCDLESVIEKYDTALPDPTRSSTTRMGRHIPCGFCYVVVGPDGALLKEPVLRHGEENLMATLLKMLQEEEANITLLRGNDYPLDMTEETTAAFEAATHCYICKLPIPRPGVKKTRDHDYTKPKNNYRNAACHGCNLNLKRRDFIPVVMHGLTHYDAHHIISSIGEMGDGDKLRAIPKTKEKYVSFSWGRLRWIDSLNFLSASLDKLSRDLRPEDMNVLKSLFPDEEKQKLLIRKGVYPYSYFSDFQKFNEKCLPPQAAFQNDLTGEHVSEDDYLHAQRVFETFKMDNLWDYHDLYLLTDVILLSDIMENFRKETMAQFNLDAIHYLTLPGFSWSAGLLFTRQELELVENMDQHLMWEAAMRGGISTINCRWAEGNNKYIPDTYCAEKPDEFIMYFDANALYSTAMTSKLPVGGFWFLNDASVAAFTVNKILEIEDDDEEGYLFDVDLEYCRELHDDHNDYPLAVEHWIPAYKNLSPLQKSMIKKHNLPREPGTKKLIPNLYDKKNYIVCGRVLKLYIQLGLKVTKIHRIMAFRQEAWLAPFIMHNIEKRKQASSAFQIALYKLYNNSIFGKTCERVRNRKNLVFTQSADKFKKLVRSPLFHSFEIFDHGLIAVERRKAVITLNRPIHCGVSVLDESKRIMSEFHYNVMKRRYGDRIKVLGSDTDSLIYSIKTVDAYKDMAEMSEIFDTSGYDKSHFLYSDENKKKLGCFTDEYNGVPIKCWVGLRPKMYSFKTGSGMEKAVGKGIPRAALKTQLSFDDYLTCLKELTVKSVTFKKIGTDQKHHLLTTFSTKRGLSAFDNKRYILKNNIDTLAFGHYKLRDLEDCMESDDSSCESEQDEDLGDEGACNLRELLVLMKDTVNL